MRAMREITHNATRNGNGNICKSGALITLTTCESMTANTKSANGQKT